MLSHFFVRKILLNDSGMYPQGRLVRTYSVVSIKRTGCNKGTGWSKNFIWYMKKRSGWKKKLHLVHEKKVQGGKKLQNSDPVLLIDTTE